VSNAEPRSVLPGAGTDVRWTGRTEITLINGHGVQVGAISVAVGSNVMTLRYKGRVLAEINRDTFHEWLVAPRSSLLVHDVTWFTRTGLTCISIEGLGAYVVPGNCIRHLQAVV
jgi:hypothetical protein